MSFLFLIKPTATVSPIISGDVVEGFPPDQIVTNVVPPKFIDELIIDDFPSEWIPHVITQIRNMEIPQEIIEVLSVISNHPSPFIEKQPDVVVFLPFFDGVPVIDDFPSDWIPYVITQINTIEIPQKSLEESIIDGFPSDWNSHIKVIKTVESSVKNAVEWYSLEQGSRVATVVFENSTR